MSLPDREAPYIVPDTDREDKPSQGEAIQESPAQGIADENGLYPKLSQALQNFDQIASQSQSVEPEKLGCCMSPFAEKLKRLSNLINMPLMIASLALDVVYLVQVPFLMEEIYIAGLLVLAGKALLSLLVAFFYYSKFVRNHTVNLAAQTLYHDDSEEVLRSKGCKVYASLFPLLFLGSFRVLSSTDFGYILLTGYAIEAFTSIGPMTFIMIFTNYQTSELITLQNAAVGLKCLLVLLFLPEVLMMFFEIMRKKQLQQAKVIDYLKPSEEQRRQKYSKRVPCIVIFSLVLFAGVLSGGLALGHPRTCDERQVLSGAVCQTCEDSLCLECFHGFHLCTKCEEGYYPNSFGKCVDCDNADPEKKCLKCQGDDDGLHTTCFECGEGYRLEEGRCVACGELGLCAVCSEKGCEECKEGYWLDDNGACVPCSDSLSLCKKCNGPDRCSECLPAAEIDEEGKCTKCSEHIGWTKHAGGDGCQCQNDLFMSVYEGYKCQTCEDYIGGCKACEVSNSTSGSRLFVDLGTDQELSLLKESSNFLLCKECGHNMFSNAFTGGCELCSSKIDRCNKCSSGGSSCLECNEGSYLYNNQRCLSCDSKFGEGCDRCERDRCHNCRHGFTMVLGLCMKNLFNW